MPTPLVHPQHDWFEPSRLELPREVADSVWRTVVNALNANAPKRRRRRKEVAPRGCYTVAQAAQLLGVDNGVVSEWIRQRELLAFNVGRGKQRPRWRVTKENLQAFIASRSTTPRPKRVKRRTPLMTNDQTDYFADQE